MAVHQHNPMGEGDVDFSGIFAKLREMDFANRTFPVGGDAISCVSIFGYPERMNIEAPRAREMIENELLGK